MKRCTKNGIAHLIEHMIFKGTSKRKAFHVISFLENVGCDLNAYTTKEETCIHGTFLYQYYDRALELFADVAFHSVFPEKELEKEKEIILDEINSYKDSPSEEIFDEFENLLFAGHPIGRNILGTAESLEKLNRSNLLRFIRRNYDTGEMILASVGNIRFDELIRRAKKYFGPELASRRTHIRQQFSGYSPRIEQTARETFFVALPYWKYRLRLQPPAEIQSYITE